MDAKIESRKEHLTNEDLGERFIAAYNAIDRELRRRIGATPEQSFSKVVKDYANRYPSEFMRTT